MHWSRAVFSAAAMLAAPLIGKSALPSRYYLTDLGAAPSFNKISINAYGQIATTYGRPSLWTPTRRNGAEATSWTTLPTPVIPPNVFNPNPSFASAVALGINDFGQVSGNLGISDFSGYAYLWTPNAPNALTGSFVLPTTSTAAAYAINNYGQLALYTGQPPSPSSIWTPIAPNADAGSASGLSMGGGAYSINGRGDVAMRAPLNTNYVFRPTVAQGTTGQYAALSATVSEINDAGWVATQSGVFLPSYTPTLTYSKIEGSPNNCVAINNSNIALVSNGALWTIDDGQVSLSSLLETHSAAGWTLASMRDLNDIGQIVGTASFDPDSNSSTNNSVTRAVLLTPLVDGDATIDQRVDFDDLLVLAQHYGQAGINSWRAGDFDGNSNVDFADLLRLAQHYDEGTVDLASSRFDSDWMVARSLVPEPAALAALSVGILSRRRLLRRCSQNVTTSQCICNQSGNWQ